MGDSKVLVPTDRSIQYKVDSGAMRFQAKVSQFVFLAPTFTLYSKHDPQKRLYKITISPVCTITNFMSENGTTTTNVMGDVDMNSFVEYWVTWYNKKIQLGVTGREKPFLVHRYEHNETIGYVQFEMGHMNQIAVEWIIEDTPVILKPLPCKIFDEELTWSRMRENRLPPNALIGGFEKEPLYVARAFYSNSLIPGKYVPTQGTAFVSWGNREHQLRDFEILCGHNAKWVKTSGNHIPSDAFVAGYSEVRREPLYVGRAMHDDCLVVGKVHTLYKSCYLPYYGKEITVGYYEILTVPKNTHHVHDDSTF